MSYSSITEANHQSTSRRQSLTSGHAFSVVLPAQPPHRVITRVEDLENLDPVLTTKVAAALLGLSISNLKKLRQRKQGPEYFRTEGGSVRYLLSAVLQYRASRTVHH